MDLVDEQDVAFVEVREQCRKVSLLLDGGAGRDADVDAHLCRDDAGERRLAESGRAVEQNVVEGLPSALRGIHVDLQVLFRFFLAQVILQRPGTQGEFQGVVLAAGEFRGDETAFKVHVFCEHSVCSLR